MIKKLDAFLSWLLKEGLTFIIFSAIMVVILFGLYHLFNSPII
jgi:vacuolar-type H+-ATPase subunit I/STV1